MDITMILIGVFGLIVVGFIGWQFYLRWRVTSIDVDEAAKRIRNGGAGVVLDVREPHEYEVGHIRGSILLPQGELDGRVREILSQGDEIIVVCASGNRSLSAANRLLDMGFGGVVNMKGGMNAWQRAGLAVTRGKSEARHRG